MTTESAKIGGFDGAAMSAVASLRLRGRIAGRILPLARLPRANGLLLLSCP